MVETEPTRKKNCREKGHESTKLSFESIAEHARVWDTFRFHLPDVSPLFLHLPFSALPLSKMIREKDSYFVKLWINQNHHNFEYFISMLDDKNHFCYFEWTRIQFRSIQPRGKNDEEKIDANCWTRRLCVFISSRYESPQEEAILSKITTKARTHIIKRIPKGIVDKENHSIRPAAIQRQRKKKINKQKKKRKKLRRQRWQRHHHWLRPKVSVGLPFSARSSFARRILLCCYYHCYYCQSRSHCHLQLAVVAFRFPCTVIRNDTISLRVSQPLFILRQPGNRLATEHTQWHTKSAFVTFIVE